MRVLGKWHITSRLALIMGAALIVLAAAGCGTKKREVLESQEYYAQGNYFYETGDYEDAKEAYQHLIEEYPFSPYTEEAELKIALANYHLKNYIEASAELEDFERMHPTSPQAALAQYYLAMCYFKQLGRPDQDQATTVNALVQFETLERRFPDSPFSQLAHERIQILRETLARNIKVISDYYASRGNFRATESRLAELLQKFPDTPVAAEALYMLGETLEKEGKKYSAAQAFAAFKWHYQGSTYAKKAAQKLVRLKQPIDLEEDPLPLVLAEAGFPAIPVSSEPRLAGANNPTLQVANSSDSRTGAPQNSTAPAAGAEQRKQSAPSGPVKLRNVRLASSDPPLSIVLDLTGPVDFDKRFRDDGDSSELTVVLHKTEPDSQLQNHIELHRSIFKDCDVQVEGDTTAVTVRTTKVANYAVIPLEGPSRLMITYTPVTEVKGEAGTVAKSAFDPTTDELP